VKRITALVFALLLLLAACAPAAPDAATAPATTGVIAATAMEATTAPANTATPSAVSATLAVQATGAVSSVPVFITAIVSKGGTPAPVPTQPPATPIPTLAAGHSPSDLKYKVLAEYPGLFYCDPDYYPVARADEGVLARQRFPELEANQEEFQAILNQNGMAGATTFDDSQVLQIYREHKKLAAVQFTLIGGKYQFQLKTKDSGGSGRLITGMIDGMGVISAQQSQPTNTSCPICLAAQTRIDTPNGPVMVKDLRPGEAVWTVDAGGARVSATIVQAVRVFVPADHQMVHVVLEDGRELWASPGHPTSDGRALGDLKAGDRLDGARISSVERVRYDQPATYDVLPAGATGFYWANGILMGSTLK
jgi:hypothetical protein